MQKIAIINGPNLNRLGKREQDVYGHQTLTDLENRLKEKASKLGVNLTFFHSNHEGVLIDKIAEYADAGFHGAIINPGGLTHTSVALRDAIAGTDIPFIEVHISNIYRRESFRIKSITATACQGVISGLGFYSYDCALGYLVQSLQPSTKPKRAEEDPKG